MANAQLLFIPAPIIGHIMSTIEIAHLLVTRDQRLSITLILINLPPTSGGSSITTYIQSLTTMDRITFIHLPQHPTPPKPNPKSAIASFNDFINSHCKYVRNIVLDMTTSQPPSGQVAGFVVDMFTTGMTDVATEFNLPTYVFFTSNAAFLGFMLHVDTLSHHLHQDVVELSNSDETVLVPSFVNPVPGKIFPTMVHAKEGVEFAVWCGRNLRRAKAILVNTFMEMETHALEWLSEESSVPPVYPVGPILNLVGGAGKPMDDDGVITWLDSQLPSTVVFLCFGSMGSFEEVQVREIAQALEQSGHRFIWSLRRPASSGPPRTPGDYDDPSVVLPDGFMERTAGIGKVIGWAPQVTVLGHRAVGGFVSHCGWNSMLESLWFGVPTATWPIYAEQQLNAFEMVVDLGLAVEIKLDYRKDFYKANADLEVVRANEIESGIRRVMEDDDLRRKVKEMSKKSRAAAAEGGSSYTSVSRLIQDLTETSVQKY